MSMIMAPALVHAALAVSLAIPMQEAASGAPQAAPTLEEMAAGHVHVGELGEKLLYLEQRLRCNCGCNLDVHSCQFQMQCGTSPVWSARIREALAAGMDVDAIEASFVAEFGPTVLMAPPAEGFNIVGYTLPALAILTAGILVGLIIRAGRGRGDVAPVVVTELSEEEQARLAAELKRLDEAESPDW